MTEQRTTLSEVIYGLANTLSEEHFPKGDLAELRRMHLQNPPAAYWRLTAQKIPEDFRTDGRRERAWAVILQGLALMSPNAHANISIGRALRSLDSDTAENRLWKLLRSRGEMLEDQVLLMARFLKSKELAMDWCGLARLLLCGSEEKRDAVCRELARGYYFSVPPQKNQTPTA